MRLYAALVLAMSAVGCSGIASDPCVPEKPVEHFTLRSPGGFEQVALEGERIFSPHMEIMRYDETYRGHVRRLTVDLRLRDDLIEGSIGNARTELYIDRFPDGFVVRGLYGGRLGQLRLRSDRLEGRLGGRAFVLRKSEENPLVYRSLAGAELSARGPTELTLPSSFLDRPTEQQAALLALFLGR